MPHRGHGPRLGLEPRARFRPGLRRAAEHLERHHPTQAGVAGAENQTLPAPAQFRQQLEAAKTAWFPGGALFRAGLRWRARLHIVGFPILRRHRRAQQARRAEMPSPRRRQ